MYIRCDCGTTALVDKATWKNWVHLAPHRQPSGLWCSTGRLQAIPPEGLVGLSAEEIRGPGWAAVP